MTEETNVGILAMEVYFPSTYISQKELEQANGVSAGKYTIGLGQESMSFSGDREDINSISLSVVQSLLEKYNISKKDIGRLEVGTESLVDKSKSTKTVLMSLFEGSGNTDIEGVTVINACYGGTAALLNALMWVDSSSWDGRYAIVVAADVAVYADGPARPTGGCGAVAMLVGRNAPLRIDLRTRTSHATHVWDFFKPKMDSEYPEVNGALSQTCYLQALDDCYTRYIAKQKSIRGVDSNITTEDFLLFHSPYNKLVQKSVSRLAFLDIVSGKLEDKNGDYKKWTSMPLDKTYEDKELESKLREIAMPIYKQKVSTGCEISKNTGNTYTASVYMNLAGLVSSEGASLDKKSIVLFSYGSGAMASMLNILPSASGSGNSSIFTLKRMQEALNIDNRLASREKLTPADLTTALDTREKSHSYIPYKPAFCTDNMFPGAFYLEEITKTYERNYRRKGLFEERVVGGPIVQDVDIEIDNEKQMVQDSLNKLKLSFREPAERIGSPVSALSPDHSTGLGEFISPGMKRNQTMVWASGRPNVRVVVTGIAAALPGRTNDVFPKGVNNIQRIIKGETCIGPIPTEVKESMLDKSVVLLNKHADGTQSKTTLKSTEENIQLCATIGHFNLTSYGVPESIASTMDRAVQVAVAAGLEALKDARIVTGEGEGLSGWVLPLSMQDTTGVVYATSFPALDAAVEEVSKFFETKTVKGLDISEIISGLRSRLEDTMGALSDDGEAALLELSKLAQEAASKEVPMKKYEFDRKFLFRVLVLGNAQLAQIVKAKGPNMQTNAACAGATQAIALAYDMIQVGRAERMIVVAGDNASSDNLMPWLGNGFRALGAATICPLLGGAAIPFDKRRSGMILGSGGIGMVLESEEGAMRRFSLASSSGLLTPDALRKWTRPFRCRLLGTLFSNSAYHGASMDRVHIAVEMERFISSVEKEQGILRSQIAKHGVYFSHETATHATPSSSCAANEIYGLRKVFGDDLCHLLILNTKGFTGHPMGVSFEDVVACEVLVSGQVPPIANYDPAGADPHLGSDLKFSKGGDYPCKYAMRFAAGFGSQIALALYGTAEVGSEGRSLI
mmetsp:Transcript_35743/g.33876  ORF Transcript_35743/g.33876 Transcript_35743/m.33876 type:complete len:1078 (+) Transcript_35743:181-3414(+)|eukprot:CAMPEP_0119039072 /NCGR_PEP_ID=MMETSP1177-20130426/8379_1 /TAXON_ID=2985 /ORGANISM="Ochromonas sp, Strain CCMP1899" /LENGTH=1077 /DNA_ID=CAMNT_0007002499 /DNA_START=85 /DNA_END=3318 /DNA_ORIENTATION=+